MPTTKPRAKKTKHTVQISVDERFDAAAKLLPDVAVSLGAAIRQLQDAARDVVRLMHALESSASPKRRGSK